MNRFINCDCIKNKKGELIPLWKIDWKLDSEYLDKDDLENSFIVPEDRNIGDFIAETDIVKALWDLIDKKVVPCKRVIKIYSDSTGRVGLKEGDEIYVKHKFSSNEIYPTKIKTITQGIQENVYYKLAIEEEVSEQRFFIWPKERERLIKTWAKFIPNPANGGDDDFIVFDSFRGEYTFGENGFTPLCSSKELNGYYKDNNLEYIIKQPRY